MIRVHTLPLNGRILVRYDRNWRQPARTKSITLLKIVDKLTKFYESQRYNPMP